MKASHKLIVPGVDSMLHQFKEEIASEFGVKLGGQTSSYENGSVGGEITRRLVQHAQSKMSETNHQ